MFLVPELKAIGANAFHDPGTVVLAAVERNVAAPVDVDGQDSTASDAALLDDPTTSPSQANELLRT
jgi:hypothetical protein